MAEVLEELELAVGTLRQDGGRERLHNLLDRDRGARQLVLGRAVQVLVIAKRVNVFKARGKLSVQKRHVPNETERAHADWLEVDITGGDLKDCSEDGQLYKVGHAEKWCGAMWGE